MKIIFAGTGDGRGIPAIGCECKRCMIARKEKGKNRRRRVCVIIKNRSGTIILDTPIDIGRIVNKYKIFDIAAIFLSHKHWDHIGGITEFEWWDAGKIPVYGNMSALANFETTERLYDRCKFHVMHDRESVKIGHIKFKAFKVNHKVPTHGLVITEDNKRIVHFSDSVELSLNDFEKRQVKKANLVIFHTPGYDGGTDHIDVVSVMKIAKKHPNTSFIISHIGHNNLSHEELEEHFASYKNLRVAYDGLEIKI
ncbi:MAG: MBL fold metallo-hydrolase [Candidatus Marinimicrobia bacterium]|nr:MBL fold metallo-hydrolase [Candidatus Neomarinimicrobiota bacterium]